jgi:hypothetical protein
VYCEARRTERAYFDGLRSLCPSGTVHLDLKYKAVHPAQLVEVAFTASVQGSYDQVWCVVDDDGRDLSDARQMAAKRGVLLAVSNPCFELWLLLHHTDCTAYVGGYADAVGRLRKHVRAYDKAHLNFDDFAEGVPSAVKRAKVLDPGHNPSTTVWRLVERVMER